MQSIPRRIVLSGQRLEALVKILPPSVLSYRRLVIVGAHMLLIPLAYYESCSFSPVSPGCGKAFYDLVTLGESDARKR
ncbi:MAG: hypothetical protein ACREX3_03080 [Gammaproteobacteria bacterium]